MMEYLLDYFIMLLFIILLLLPFMKSKNKETKKSSVIKDIEKSQGIKYKGFEEDE